MVHRILQLLSIRCAHRKLSQPFAAATAVPTSRVGNAQWDAPLPATRHYVVCLDCGHKMEYDWSNMRVVRK